MVVGADALPQLPNVVGEFDDVLSDLGRIVAGLDGTQLVTLQVPDDVWAGASANAYEDALAALKNKVLGLSASVFSCREALEPLLGQVEDNRAKIPSLQQQWDDANDVYRAEVVRAVEMSIDPVDQARLEESARITRDDARGVLKKSYEVLTESLELAVAEASGKVAALLEELVPVEQRGSRAAFGAYVMSDVPVVNGQAQWVWAQERADSIIAMIHDEDLSEAEVLDFVENHAGDMQDPFVAQAVLERVSPDEAFRFVINLESQRGHAPVAEAQIAVGTLLVLGTGGVNLANATAQAAYERVKAGLRLSNGFSLDDATTERMEELKKAGNSWYSLEAARIAERPGGPPQVRGYDLLSELMGSAATANENLALGPAFFAELPSGDSLAMDFVSWQNDVWNSEPDYFLRHEHVEYGPFMIAATGGEAFPTGTVREGLQPMFLLMDRPEYLEQDGAVDSVLLEAERARLDGVQFFLTSEPSFHVPDVEEDSGSMDMTRYLTGHRQIEGPRGYYGGFLDGGEAYGEVIQQASVPRVAPPEPVAGDFEGQDPGAFERAHEQWERDIRLWKEREVQAARIAGSFLYGYQEGLENPLGGIWHGQDAFGYTNPNLRSWLGEIAAPHMRGIGSVLDTPSSLPGVDVFEGPSVATKPLVAFDAEISRSLMTGVFVDIGFDDPEAHGIDREPVVDRLLAGIHEGYSADVHRVVAEGGDGDDLRETVSSWALPTELVMTAPERAALQGAELSDAQNGRMKDLLHGGMGIASVAAAPAFPVAAAVVGVTDIASVPVLDYFLPTDASKQFEMVLSSDHTVAEEYMSRVILAELADNGSFNFGTDGQPSEVQRLIAKEGEPAYVKDGRVMSLSDMTSKQREAFANAVGVRDATLQSFTRYETVFSGIEAALRHADEDIEEAYLPPGQSLAPSSDNLDKDPGWKR